MEGRTSVLLIVLLVLALLAAAGPGRAQTPAGPPARPVAPDAEASASPFVLTRAAIQTHRQAIVTEALELDAWQSQTFWPLYREYRLAMRELDDRLVRLLARYLDSYPSLADTTAGQLVEESLGIDEARNRVRRRYVARFRTVLRDPQVVRLVQVERRLDAVVDAELAARVPLVE